LNRRDAAAQGVLTGNVPNPYNINNFESLKTTNPVLYQRMSTNSFFTSSTVQRQQLLRPFSQFNNLTFAEVPLGKVKVHSLQVLGNRRFANGFTANVALAFSHARELRTVNEFDRDPTVWWDPNTSRPYRLSGGAVWELPFGAGRRMLNSGGVLAAIAGGWQVAGTFEKQPGSLISFTTNTNGAPNGNVFYNGDIGNIKKDEPEIALNADGTLDPAKYWFNIEGFERNPANTPTTFQTRAFPLQIPGLRGPGLQYVNMNVSRTFGLGGRRTLQTRLDIQNLFNYAGFSNPVTDPTNTNFGKVVQAVGAAGAMRFFNFGVRLAF